MIGLFGMMMKVEKVRLDIELEEGFAIGPLSIVDTPGHTDGSITVYLPGEAVFVGDLLRTEGEGNAEARVSEHEQRHDAGEAVCGEDLQTGV